ncbi:formiminoglutamate deiminase [Aliiruegeria haliotis]|uniref:Formiminoglutamate deiminase n=1 Tax=Aliiruegeria haliotis TaxID=1280846 RepID=A0A2T0RWF9_9RHOB|nr:formimidoylglutamate deiminase [Aliiruegeria haliotis]PRY25462.1 formiminoglutamate deiminase [Aliiruegeria haliotis]
MQRLWARQALVDGAWQRDVLVEIGVDGRIAHVAAGRPAEGQTVGLLLPAPANAHSHAFQRAMAGLSEGRGPGGQDSFWTWRHLMYQFLGHLTPADVEAIAAFVQMEMLEAGFGASVEFHYLHHQPDGAPYAHLAEMSERIAAAAATSGIGLTLLPVAYQFGGCDGRPLGEEQRRFGNDPERFARLVAEAGVALAGLPDDAVLGVAPHSLRAVGAADLSGFAKLVPGGPVHMHLAEQIGEVAEVEHCYGHRPVDWILDKGLVDDRWCLIHCTQMTPNETTGLAATGAVAGLCPITESNLGDGIFDGLRWARAGGALAVGSDSNIRISLNEELRVLEYSQRLRDRSRAVLATPEMSTGRRLFTAVATGGAQAAGRSSGRLAIGGWADLVALNAEDPALAGLDGDPLLDSWIFAAGDKLVWQVWSAGRHLVQEGRHVRHEEITAAYCKVITRLREQL